MVNANVPGLHPSPKRLKGCGRFQTLCYEVSASGHNRGLVINDPTHRRERCGAWTVEGYWQSICKNCMTRGGLKW